MNLKVDNFVIVFTFAVKTTIADFRNDGLNSMEQISDITNQVTRLLLYLFSMNSMVIKEENARIRFYFFGYVLNCNDEQVQY